MKINQIKKHNTIKFSVYVMILCYVFSCKKHNNQNAFYFWKSNYNLSSIEKNILQENQIKTLYVHYFDVQWNNKKNAPIPVNTITFNDSVKQNIIPVIYLDNLVMEKISENNLDILSKNVLKLANTISLKNKINYHEIQFDCDWTLSTKQNYFSFLKKIRNNINDTIQLSATIRLHQVKYKDKTGVPPVNKAVIMYYNMGDLENYTETNSILNNITAQKYISQLNNYPLYFDIALPLFSWSIVFRNEKIIALKSTINKADLSNDTLFQKINSNKYLAKQSFFIHGLFIKVGDEIRLEFATENDIKQALKNIEKVTKNKKYNIILYHLNTDDINQIGHEKIKQIFNYH